MAASARPRSALNGDSRLPMPFARARAENGAKIFFFRLSVSLSLFLSFFSRLQTLSAGLSLCSTSVHFAGIVSAVLSGALFYVMPNLEFPNDKMSKK
jgi:hypothetical protein